MGFDGRILSRATEIYEQNVARHEKELDARAAELGERFPRLREIDAQLRHTVIRAINLALSSGADVGENVRQQQEKNRELRYERAAILRENGLPEAYLDREPLCPVCSDTGYTEAGMCACLRAVYREEQRRELSFSTGMPPTGFRDADLSLFSDERTGSARISARENMQYILHVCRSFAEDRASYGSLLFSGPPGTGKTFVAVCLAYHAVDQGCSVLYESAVRLLAKYEDLRFRRDDDTVKNDVARYENCDLLILDDLGTEMATAVTNAGLYQLLNTRLTAGRACVVVTNQWDDELRKRYPSQILSRLDGFTRLRFFGADLRSAKPLRFC